MEREGLSVRARIYAPPRSGPHPTWILLHGVTRPGLDHPQLVRFASALASSGALVFIPEVPEWKALRLAPDLALPTLAASLQKLDEVPAVKRGKYGLIGFSFGGPQAMIAASHEAVADQVAGVVSFGGYCDLESTVRFQFTGEDEGNRRRRRVRPDPYGRWVVGANFLTASPGFADAQDVAQALWELAAAAGDRRAPAWSPEYDALKARLRDGIVPERRELFDCFAPPAESDPDRKMVDALVPALVEGGRRSAPLMDPLPFLGRVRHRVEILHGRDDRLSPFTESERLARALPGDVEAHVTVTGLFSHSRGERVPLLRRARGGGVLFPALRRVLGMG